MLARPSHRAPQGASMSHVPALGVESQTHKDAWALQGLTLPFKDPSPTRQAVTVYRCARPLKEPHSLPQPLPCREWMIRAPPRAALWTARTQRRS